MTTTQYEEKSTSNLNNLNNLNNTTDLKKDITFPYKYCPFYLLYCQSKNCISQLVITSTTDGKNS